MGKSNDKVDFKGRREINPFWLLSAVFLVVGLWVVGSSVYSRRAIAPALAKLSNEPARWDKARRLMSRATRLVFGRGIFAPLLNRLGEVPECVSSRTLPEVADEFEAALDEEKKTADKLTLVPDASTAIKYGGPCAEYVANLASQRSIGKGPSNEDAAAEIMRFIEPHVALRFAARYGEKATAILLQYRTAKRNGQLSEDHRQTLTGRWREVVEEEIENFRGLAMINGRNGYVFGGLLLLASAAFFLIPILGRSVIPQESLRDDRPEEKR